MKQCRQCRYSALCLPQGSRETLFALFEYTVAKKGMRLYYTKFELMTMQGLTRVRDKLSSILAQTCIAMSCIQPAHVVVSASPEADMTFFGISYTYGTSYG